MTLLSKTASGLALAASMAMAATPAAAADVPAIGQGSVYAGPASASDADSYEGYRRWRHRRNRVDAGDVITGIAIIGGLAAIASAASKSDRRSRDRYEDRRYRDDRYRDSNPRQVQTSNLDAAVSACTSAIARDVRVDSVDSVSRVGEGWQVSGRLYNGNGFNCNVGSGGQIERIDYSGNFSGASAEGGYDGYQGAPGTNASAASVEDNQLSDDAYYQARAEQAEQPVQQAAQQQVRQQVEQAAPQDSQVAYPGGPIEGDLGG